MEILEHVDVVIVGAGLSGVGGACHLKMRCPGKSFVVFEGREAMGGTWDLFRYPGVRSDSDMFTLGYRFRPWRESKVMAEGPAILNYIRDTAAEFQVDKTIRYNHRVRRASWSSEEARWTVDIEVGSNVTENGAGSGIGSSVTGSGPRSRIKRAQGARERTGRKNPQVYVQLPLPLHRLLRLRQGYTPEWPGVERSKGAIVHPQHGPRTSTTQTSASS